MSDLAKPLSDHDRAVVVRKYGLLDPIDWAQDCHDHIWLQNKLWNRLVQIESRSRLLYRAAMRADPAVAAAEAELQALLDKRTALIAERKRLRAAARKKVPTPETDAAIATMRLQITASASAAKALRTAARDSQRPMLAAIESARFAAVKIARNESGLWWGNYNRVCASYDAARSRAMKDGAELKFHRFDGAGLFMCQIQGGASAADILAGKCSQVRITPRAPVMDVRKSHDGAPVYRAGAWREHLSITIYTGKDIDGDATRRMLTFPLILDRPLDPDARVKEVRVVRRKVGTGYRWHVVFTSTKDAVAAPVHDGKTACGLDLNWRMVRGGLRVATIVSSRSGAEHIVLPDRWLRAMEHTTHLHAELDAALNDAKPLLQQIDLDAITDPALRMRLVSLRRVPRCSAGSLAGVVIRLRAVPGIALDALELWRVGDKKKRQQMDGMRRHLLGHREEIYRIAAKRIAEHAVIGMDPQDMRKLALRETPDGEENPLHQTARRNRQWAAVGLLREWIAKQAGKTGAQIIEVSGPTTETCSGCGHRDTVPPDEIVHACTRCGNTWDRDENAARNRLHAASFADPRERAGGDGPADGRSQSGDGSGIKVLPSKLIAQFVGIRQDAAG